MSQSYADIKYQLGLIGKNENEKLLKAIDQLEKQRILEKLDIAPIDIFGLKASMNEIHELDEVIIVLTIFTIINDSRPCMMISIASIMYLLLNKRHFEGFTWVILSIS